MKMKDRCKCRDCEKDTMKGDENYYMVLFTLWDTYGVDGMLCVRCLEERVGRKLTYYDFTNAPINRTNTFVQALKPTRRNKAKEAAVILDEKLYKLSGDVAEDVVGKNNWTTYSTMRKKILNELYSKLK